ncbi:MAG: hypothetical protein HY909_01390 [Deltaproteobacteria bacterium]|nr:hypothetical protein [Deltaproteobacteria bacterium]
MPKPPTRREAIAELAERFQRNGYVRIQNHERLHEVGYQLYKKGYEVRLTAHSEEELHRIQGLLRALGFTVARPFAKAHHFRQPIYGREQVRNFLLLIGYSAG